LLPAGEKDACRGVACLTQRTVLARRGEYSPPGT
jgi:hypothetical protein